MHKYFINVYRHDDEVIDTVTQDTAPTPEQLRALYRKHGGSTYIQVSQAILDDRIASALMQDEELLQDRVAASSEVLPVGDDPGHACDVLSDDQEISGQDGD